MPEPQLIFDANRENFQALVVENSHKGPVMTNFWSPKAGPCLRLYPVLESLVKEFGGQFILVNVNTEKEKRLAVDLGVTSVPTVKIFRDGEVVDSIHGYQSDNDFRRMLTGHLARPSDEALKKALLLYQSGDTETAITRLAELAMEDADNLRIVLALAKLLVREGRTEDAHTVLNTLPAEARRNAQITSLLTHLDFMLIVAQAPDPDKLDAEIKADPEAIDARFQRAALHLAADDYESALALLLQIMRSNPDYKDQAGRRGLVAVFEILGSDHPLVKKYQSQMGAYLH